MNRILLTGNLVREIKLEKNKNNKPFVKNVIAVKDNWNTDFEKTYFINIECYNKETLTAITFFTYGLLFLFFSNFISFTKFPVNNILFIICLLIIIFIF